MSTLSLSWCHRQNTPAAPAVSPSGQRPDWRPLDAVAERLRADRLVIGNHQLGGVIGVELAACRPVSSAMQLLGEPVDDLVVGVL